MDLLFPSKEASGGSIRGIVAHDIPEVSALVWIIANCTCQRKKSVPLFRPNCISKTIDVTSTHNRLHDTYAFAWERLHWHYRKLWSSSSTTFSVFTAYITFTNEGQNAKIMAKYTVENVEISPYFKSIWSKCSQSNEGVSAEDNRTRLLRWWHRKVS